MVSVKDLRQLSMPLVARQTFDAPGWDQHSPLLWGRMQVVDIQPGLRLRLADVSDRQDLTTRAELPAGVKIALVIDGEARVRYGNQAVRLGPSAQSIGSVVRLPHATEFARQGRAGGHERTLVLSLTPDWLSSHGCSATTMRMPMLTRWSPSSGLHKLASRLFDTQCLHARDSAHRLRMTGFALAMAGEALAALQAAEDRWECSVSVESRPQDRRLQRLMTLIDSGEAQRLGQEEVARYLGMSLSSLQRRFRACYGESLGRFMRRRRLETALSALRNGGVSVEAAAILAGYTSAANFATAFKRQFGLRPGELRRVTNTRSI